MSKIDDGGPAFPIGVVNEDDYGHARVDKWSGGMSLRDWFAGQVLAGLVVMSHTREWRGLMGDVKDDGEDDAGVVVEMACRLADAMLAERAKK